MGWICFLQQTYLVIISEFVDWVRWFFASKLDSMLDTSARKEETAAQPPKDKPGSQRSEGWSVRLLADWRLKISGKEENVKSWCGWYIYIEVLLLKYCKFTISKTDQEEVVNMRIAARGLIRRDPSDPSSEHLFHVHRAMREQLPALTSHVRPHLFLRGLPHSAEPIITRVSYLCRLEKSCVFRLFNWLQGIFMFLQ